MPLLTSAVKFSPAEQDMMIGWQDPAAWDPTTGTSTTPPGLGKFLKPPKPLNVPVIASRPS